MIISFEHMCELDTSNLKETQEVDFLNRNAIESKVPKAMLTVDELIDEVCEIYDEELALTQFASNPWLHVMHGPADGIGWHDEGIREDNLSVVIALNDIPDDVGGNLLFEDGSAYKHHKGRTVVFPSSTKHRVSNLHASVDRYALAFLIHRIENG